mmetsp:Transcript_124416/g.202321  ORF Transcript_124416/g.202321 Transcript_124416/m.202321 type:complete len:102 (+) Transcript_124416:516-821(+)
MRSEPLKLLFVVFLFRTTWSTHISKYGHHGILHGPLFDELLPLLDAVLYKRLHRSQRKAWWHEPGLHHELLLCLVLQLLRDRSGRREPGFGHRRQDTMLWC